jgi:hypothetical protein
VGGLNVLFFRNMTEVSTPKRKRTSNFEDREKEILCQIIKETDGGRVWKMIKEGTGTNTQKYLAWEKVTKSFNQTTGKNCTRKKVRDLFDRIKKQKKQDHDRVSLDRQERNFSKACGVTGGGPPPQVPPEPDGDEDTLVFNDLEPTTTQFNVFTPAHDTGHMPPSNPRLPRPQFRPPSSNGPRFRFPAPSPFTQPLRVRTCSPTSPSQIFSEEEESSENSELPNLHYVPIRTTPPSSSPSLSHHMGGPPSGEAAASSPAPAPAEVVDIITGGERISVEAAEAREPPPKKSKKGTTKNMNETATDYYSEMLKIHKKLAVLKESVLKRREKVLKRRERVEIIKEKVLMNRLVKEGGTVPEGMSDDMEQSDDMDSGDDEDEYSSDERNCCFHLLSSKTSDSFRFFVYFSPKVTPPPQNFFCFCIQLPKPVGSFSNI